MIIRFNKNFKNAYEQKRKKITSNLVDDEYWQCICDEYFNMNNIKDNNIDSILNKFKNICCFNFFSSFVYKDIKNFNDDYNYLANCIKKDINKYIKSDNVKFTDVFYHPLNTCVIYKKEEIISNNMDTKYYFSNNNIKSIYCNIKYKDIKYDNDDLIDCANIFFKYNCNGTDGAFLVCFLKSLDYCYYKIMPKFKKVKCEDVDKIKQKILKFLNTHQNLQNISNLKDFEFGS